MRQSVREIDFSRSMLDYICEQLQGRVLLEFPEEREIVDWMCENFQHSALRYNEISIHAALMITVQNCMESLTPCLTTGCDSPIPHEFLREVINLVWNARLETDEWLRRKGIVVGRSVN